ncbi:MAG: hypothetical protein PHW82_10465 [Bacteroidales bacterium]|nr:hypothetical protein [Bacteroidales bacterium]
MVVLYDLNSIKAYIANRLPSSVKVIWRFFGLELYQRMPEYVYSEQTAKALKIDTKKYDFLYFKNKLALFYNSIRFKTIFKNEFEKAAFSRVNYFHGLSLAEYLFLKGYWPKLPPFLQISYNQHSEIHNFRKKESNLIIIGNNRSAYNNHLDIIEVIKRSKNRSNYVFLLLFNYGQKNAYTDIVKRKAGEVKEIKIIEDFMPLEQFKALYSNADALVLNGHRQMAMANVFEALRKNTKIYLNEKNVILKWLKEEGFKVFTTHDFYTDLDANTLCLSEDDVLNNQAQLVKFATKFSHQNFHSTLVEIINNN